MNTTRTPHGAVTGMDTLTIQRQLPGSIDRVWQYLTESDLRRQWLASGDMDMRVGGTVDFTWRNDDLMKNPGKRPEGASAEHSMECRITELDPPRKLSITWGSTGGVSFTLEPNGNGVLLTVVHHRVADKSILLKVSAGWHMHLDVLTARLNGEEPEPFWDGWQRLVKEYEQRVG
ncbi:hypothetical protein GJW-30_1_03330 [Variibacter gotjawalensis]|uniref:Activator of Hsp90 ATPase homologue 1/2-like C-terminal domain-containing protein n=1 Tax=Variibacter gotjawalensis TaxID=1333996 RepID=A0A0S3PXU7_9BRAD|nr:SRPBCC family protein [Variibacter gotjawalensis]NIK46615.1 uncharacterized protein YndB with AHSA1/START domain [Variibacter gotjawalensis]RZS48518.1 uncharacterized protein YndB with AHSA1/START domain [Variibacter gotjawalensis]BAT60780.1 hypothetical protein GJW-30_1_03330 [Variibacter gotjawalensis]